MARAVAAIVGTTGSVGPALVANLSKLGFTVRAGTRDVTSPKVATLGAFPNVTLVAADPSEPASLAALFAGASVAFINAAPTENRGELSLAAARAAFAAGVAHVVVLSVPAASRLDTIFGSQFGPLEDALRASPKGTSTYTIVQLPFFLNIFLGQGATAKANPGAVYAPVRGDALTPAVSTDEVGEAVANIMAEPARFANRTLRLSSQPFTHEQFTVAVAKVAGHPVNYVRVPYEAARATFAGYGMPAWQVAGALELFQLIDASAPAMQCDAADLTEALGRAPLTIDEFVTSFAAVFQ